MTEKKPSAEAAEPKAKAAKKPAASKAPAKAQAPREITKAEVVPAKKPVTAGKTITLIQTGSPIGRQAYQRAVLIGLGLNKINRTRTLQDTPEIRGMITRVKHLVKVVE